MMNLSPKNNITEKHNFSTFGPLAREAKNALVVIKRHGFTSRTVEILTIFLFSFFENCFLLSPQSHDQIRAEVVNFIYKARAREKLTKAFIARRFQKILQNLILAGHAVPREEFPAGLVTEDESLDKVLSRLALKDFDPEALEFQNETKVPRKPGVRHKAQLRDFAMRRDIKNRKPMILKQQDLFCLEEAA